MEQKTEPYVKANDVCKHFRIHRDTFVKWCKKGAPRVQVGYKTFRYKISEVDAWVKKTGGR